MQDVLRALADRLLPRRRHAVHERRRARGEYDSLALRISPDRTVLAGPFAGMRIPREASWHAPPIYLVGTYERPLHPWILDAVHRTPSVVVDVGAADGYYAVGLARLLPDCVVYAFDLDPLAQQATRRTARMNDVTNVVTRGRITPQALQRVLVRGAFVISDCEGYELELLDLESAPLLASAYIIVELHDTVAACASRTIPLRFGETHRIHMIGAANDTPEPWSHLAHLTQDDIVKSTCEGRTGLGSAVQWAVMIPRDAGGNHGDSEQTPGSSIGDDPRCGPHHRHHGNWSTSHAIRRRS